MSKENLQGVVDRITAAMPSPTKNSTPARDNLPTVDDDDDDDDDLPDLPVLNLDGDHNQSVVVEDSNRSPEHRVGLTVLGAHPNV